MRLAFFGSPDFAVPALCGLAKAGHEIVAVYCQPPKPAERGLKETKCAVQRAAEALGLPVRTPTRLRAQAEEHRFFASLGLDAAVVAAYGLILPKPMLEAPQRGCLNIHASLLPRWRGAAPIQAAILAGDAETGVTIMRMDEGLDTGPILLREVVPIGPRDTAAILHDRLAEVGARLVLRALTENPPAIPQPAEGATYAPKLSRTDGVIDWTRPAQEIDRKVRAFDPWPSTTARIGTETVKILATEPVEERCKAEPGTLLDEVGRIACGDGTVLRLLRLQRPGRAAQDAGAFLRGLRLGPGARFS